MEMLSLNFSGETVNIAADSDFLGLLKHDFSFFVVAKVSAPHIAISVRFERPEFADLPESFSSHINERCVVYKSGRKRWQVYYNNEALSEWDTETDRASFYSTDRKLLHELVYLFILSRTGERLDMRGMHRIHASAICKDGRAVIFTMPSGGGKTTLAMAGLDVPGWQFMSDDSPYVGRNGRITAFPSRLGLRQAPANVPGGLVNPFRRREFNDKYLVNSAHFSGRIATQAEPSVFLVGYRKLSGDPQLFPISKFTAFCEAFKTLVVGLGLPQLLEYFLRLDFADVAVKGRIVLSRTVACVNLIRNSKTFGIALGPDVSKNVLLYQEFLTRLPSGGPPISAEVTAAIPTDAS